MISTALAVTGGFVVVVAVIIGGLWLLFRDGKPGDMP